MQRDGQAKVDGVVQIAAQDLGQIAVAMGKLGGIERRQLRRVAVAQAHVGHVRVLRVNVRKARSKTQSHDGDADLLGHGGML